MARLSVIIVEVVVLGLLVSSCARRDFDRAIHVGDAYLPEAPIIQRDVQASPKGKLVFALPNGACEPIKSGVIRFNIKSETQNFIGDLDIADLTWSHALNSCDAIGYARSEPSERSANKNIPADFISAQAVKMSHIKLDMTGIPVSNKRKVMVWLVYGDRVPSEKIWANR